MKYNHINFLEGNTNKIATEFAHFICKNKNLFSVLELRAGGGKTSIALRTASVLAEMKNLEKMNIIIVAPVKKIDEGGWQGTYAWFKESVSSKQLKLIDVLSLDKFSTLYKNETKKEDEWKRKAEKEIIKKSLKWGEKKGLYEELNGSEKAIFIEYCKNVICRKNVDKMNELIHESEKYRMRVLEKTNKELSRGFSFYNYHTHIKPIHLEKIKSKAMTFKKMVDFYDLNKDNTLIIIDEVHNYKNSTSIRGMAIRYILKKYQIPIIGLTATPHDNGLLDDAKGYVIYNQFYNSVNDIWKQHNMTRFDKNHRPNPYKRDGTVDENVFQNYSLYKERVRKTIFTPETKVDTKMFPTLIPHLINYDVSKRSKKKLTQLSKDYLDRKYEYAITYLSDIRKVVAMDTNHLKELKKILEENRENHIQPLIFYKYNDELGDNPNDYPVDYPIKKIENKGILCLLKKIGWDYSIINGNHSFDEVDVNNLNQCIVIQIQSGNSAIEFKKSNLTIFYSLNDSYQMIRQAVGRNIRYGANHDVNNYFLTSNSADDKRVLKNLTKKKKEVAKNYSDAIKVYKKMKEEEYADLIAHEILEEE